MHHGVIVEGLFESIAEYYSLELAEKVIRGMRINAEKCQYTGGGLPLGYKIDSNKMYQIDEEEAYFVKKVFNMYLEGKSMESIAEYLTQNGIKNTFGNEYKKNGIRKILGNEKYIGVYLYDDIRIEGGIPKIIEKETFDRVQEMLLKNKRAPARKKAKCE